MTQETKSVSSNTPAERKPSSQERFTNQVMALYANGAGEIKFTDNMKQLIYGYFIEIDAALKAAEEKRASRIRNQDPVPVTWQNVNLNDLALDVVYYSKLGLDMQLKNHLSAIPYKNNKTGKYDVTLMEGYNGIKLIAQKYAAEKPIGERVELVYSNDVFVPIKKSKSIDEESYTFDIPNPFDRGTLLGGFGYLEYEDPKKNKLVIMTKAQIDKRKPKYASPEFWGGEKDQWVDGKKVGKEQIEGWYDEMAYKTVVREVYSQRNLPLDPAKIDEAYRYHIRREAENIQALASQRTDYSDAIPVDFDSSPVALTQAISSSDHIHTLDMDDSSATGQLASNESDQAPAAQPAQMKMDF